MVSAVLNPQPRHLRVGLVGVQIDRGIVRLAVAVADEDASMTRQRRKIDRRPADRRFRRIRDTVVDEDWVDAPL